MVLGAMLDAGVSLEALNAGLAKLNLPDFSLTAKKVHKKGIGGTQAEVRVAPDASPHCRTFDHICDLIDKSSLDKAIQEKSIAVFLRLAEAEAHIHQTDINAVHFHEVGAVDAIVDIVGSVIGFSLLGIERIDCSPVHVGSGTVKCAHGILPVPAPATAELMRDKPFYSTGIKGELLTPTGAAIVATLSTSFGPMPLMTLKRVGYGSGRADLEIPNLLRLFVGEIEDGEETGDGEKVVVLETNIDDMNPQLYDHLFERLFEKGARDVFLTPVQMKKNRPGTVVSVVAPSGRQDDLAKILMEETTTLGVRWRVDQRIIAQRWIESIETDYGPIQVKVACYRDRIVNIAPEYDDCKRIAKELKIPLKKVMDDVRSAALQHIRHAKNPSGDTGPHLSI